MVLAMRAVAVTAGVRLPKRCSAQPVHCANMRGARLVRHSFMALRALRWLGSMVLWYCAK